MKHIHADEVQKRLAAGAEISIVDVREASELASGKIPGAKHIPLGHLLARRGELDKALLQVLVCASGHRSQLGAFLLRRHGFEVLNMKGGMNTWHGELE